RHHFHNTSFSFFSLLSPPAPLSTLFPYTTLFRSGAEGPEEARGVLIRRAYGLCHARHLRPEPTGWCGRRPADAQPRLRDRRVIPPGWHPVRKDASADDRGPRWHREHMAALHDLLRRLRPRAPCADGAARRPSAALHRVHRAIARPGDPPCHRPLVHGARI